MDENCLELAKYFYGRWIGIKIMMICQSEGCTVLAMLLKIQIRFKGPTNIWITERQEFLRMLTTRMNLEFGSGIF